MKRLRDIETTVLKTLGAVDTEGNGTLGIDMLELAASRYREKYGYVPEVWSKVLGAASRFRVILVEHGYDDEDIMDMTILELRDAVSSLEYMEVREATSSGGVKVRRVPFKQAA